MSLPSPFLHLQKPALKESAPPVKATSVAFPNCNMRGGLCDIMLKSLPIAIIIIQFIRDGYEVVQDGVITLSNDPAGMAFGRSDEQLTGSLFLSTCSDALPFGAWHRCLWVASSGKTETMNIGSPVGGQPSGSLTITPYGDGLMLAIVRYAGLGVT